MLEFINNHISEILNNTPLFVYIIVFVVLAIAVVKFVVSRMFSLFLYAIVAVLIIVGFLTIIKIF